MPDDDITHPIPDLTGYITEGQMVLDRSLYIKGIYPPINVLPSLSRLMSDGIGKDRTRADHSDISSQLYASYARAKGIERLATIMGEEELSSIDKQYLKFSEEFETRFVNQGETVNRSIFETLDLAWEVVRILPERELTRVTDEEIKIYGRKR
jgi:V/A-type H+-transporting ATPase subunit B